MGVVQQREVLFSCVFLSEKKRLLEVPKSTFVTFGTYALLDRFFLRLQILFGFRVYIYKQQKTQPWLGLGLLNDWLK